MDTWIPVAEVYDPIQVGSIDATDTEPHDHGTIRALNSIYKPNKGVVGDPERTIFVGRLNHCTTEEQLKNIFSKYGKVESCRLVRDIITGFSKGYAFVEFSDQLDAKISIRKLNHTYIDERRIIVMFECERVMPGWVPRRLGGGFGGRKESGQLRFGGVERPFRRPIIVPENLRIKKESLKVDVGQKNNDGVERLHDVGYKSNRIDTEKISRENNGVQHTAGRTHSDSERKRIRDDADRTHDDRTEHRKLSTLNRAPHSRHRSRSRSRNTSHSRFSSRRDLHSSRRYADHKKSNHERHSSHRDSSRNFKSKSPSWHRHRHTRREGDDFEYDHGKSVSSRRIKDESMRRNKVVISQLS